MSARFVPNTPKAVEAILWLVAERPGIDVYHVVKCTYYADKYHLNHYGRPVIGDVYHAAAYGPLGQCVYGLLTRQPLELIALQSNGHLPLAVLDDQVVTAERGPNLRRLSSSDVEALSWALSTYGDVPFDDLVEESHAEEAYRKADGGVMRYEDMLDPIGNRAAREAELEATASRAVF
jgi:uncharacterized phage-associated protein